MGKVEHLDQRRLEAWLERMEARNEETRVLAQELRALVDELCVLVDALSRPERPQLRLIDGGDG